MRDGREPQTQAPRLNRRGRLVVVAGVALLFVSATSGAPWIAAAGAALLAFGAVGLALGREAQAALAGLRLDWASDAPPMRPCGQPVELGLYLGTARGRVLRGLQLEIIVSGPVGLEVPSLRLDAPAEAETQLPLTVTPPRAGLWRIWGVRLSLPDAAGLTTALRWQPLPLFLHAGPRSVPPTAGQAVLHRVGAVRDREGRHLDRQTGSGLELRELRDYVPGDPLKAVAWKASARRQRWLVRAYEDESMRRFQVVMGIGPDMRDGPPGRAPLDLAIDLAAHLSHLSAAERVGLTTYDHRVVAHLRPDTGRAHGQRLLQQILDVTRVVDEDLTEVADAELWARVGQLLEAQEGLSLRRLPYDLARLANAEVLVDPVRELYDESAIFTHVSAVVARERDRGHAALFGKSRPALDLAQARLRLYCALHAVPLPYRRTHIPQAAETGLSAALNRNLIAGSAETLVVISDFRGLAPDGPALRTMRLCRAHKRRVVAVPVGPALLHPVRQALLAAGARLVEL